MAAKAKAKRLSVKLHAEVYTEAGARQAAAAYADFAEIVITVRGAYIEAAIAPRGAALPPRLLEEFLNQALANSI